MCSILFLKRENTVAMQPNKDAFKLFSPATDVPQVFQYVDSLNSMAMNYVPNDFNEMAIPVSYRHVEHGEAQLQIEMDEINPEWKITLEDKLLHTLHNLRHSVYSFHHEGGTATNRFVIHINQKNASDQNR